MKARSPSPEIDRWETEPNLVDKAHFNLQGILHFLDINHFKGRTRSMITRMTGKNQATVPAEIVEKAGLRNGTRLDWRMTERPDVLEVHVLPDLPSLAAGLRGRGKLFKKTGGSPVDRLHEEREREERERDGR